MGKAGGSMGEARFFTIRQCPDCMCDLPHISGFAGLGASVNEESPQIGTIIRKYFPKDGAAAATIPRLGFQGSTQGSTQASICLQPKASRKGPQAAKPADFRCETAQWQVF